MESGSSMSMSLSRSPSPQKNQNQSSLTPTLSNDSSSSDIYDPGSPIIPLSPVDSSDSPLPTSKGKATNSKVPFNLEDDDDDEPSSAVSLNQKEKYLQKLNRQERVIEEVKIAIKPHYKRRCINKEQYKDVLRQLVPKICHSKNGEINPIKIRSLVKAYVKKVKRQR